MLVFSEFPFFLQHFPNSAVPAARYAQRADSAHRQTTYSTGFFLSCNYHNYTSYTPVSQRKSTAFRRFPQSFSTQTNTDIVVFYLSFAFFPLTPETKCWILKSVILLSEARHCFMAFYQLPHNTDMPAAAQQNPLPLPNVTNSIYTPTPSQADTVPTPPSRIWSKPPRQGI